jgi:hypothetical protein
LRIEVGVPSSDELRCVLAVSLTDPATGASVTSDPVFLTAVRGEVIASDIPPTWLSDESLEILKELDQANGELNVFAERLRREPSEAWTMLVEVTEELGVSNVAEAAALAGLSLTRGEALLLQV